MDLGQRDILLRFVHILIKHKIAYLLTGSFAVSFYGRPRATHDIDFVLEVWGEDLERLKKVLGELSNEYLIDIKQVENAVNKGSQFNIFHLPTGIKIDFWIVGKGQFERNKFKRRKEILIERQKISLISPEDLILTKLLWSKEIRSERHMRDCVGIVKIQRGKLDDRYLDRWAKKLGVGRLLKVVYEGEY